MSPPGCRFFLTRWLNPILWSAAPLVLPNAFNMIHTSYIELDKQALHNNIEHLRSLLPNGARFSMVIKANAYGHGIEDIVPLAEECGVDYFSVFSGAEAMRTHRVKRSQGEIMVMGWLAKEQLEWVIEHDISFFVFTLDRLRAAGKVAARHRKKARIHLELETGMHRTGLRRQDLETALEWIRRRPDCFHLEGICTHLAGAESIANHDRVSAQIKYFHQLCTYIQDEGFEIPLRHMACSAGLLNYPATALDMVRIGIACYGFWPSNETRMNNLLHKEKFHDPLLRVLSWKSEVMSVNRVGEGEYISYGKSFLTNRETLMATVPVGYGYGFSRKLSNLGYVLIHGKRSPVIGLVNMNMLAVDVTDLNGVREGDEVVMIGNQEEKTITVASFSDISNNLNYETLTRLPNDIPRVVV